MNKKQFTQMIHGNEEMVDAFVLEYYPKVYAYLYRRLLDTALAKDFTQDTFVHFFAEIERYENRDKHLNYLYRIAIHLVYDHAKKNKVETQELIEENAKDSTYDGHRIFQKKEEVRVLRSWVRELPNHLQDVVLLRFEEDMKYKDMAQILDMPVSTIKSQVALAISLLEKKARAEGWK